MRPFTAHRFLPLAVVLAAALAGCTDGDAGEAASRDVESTATTAGNGSDGQAAASCVAEYAQSPCDLLTAELVRGAVEGAPGELEQDSYTGSSFTSCSYSWPSDRTESREIMGRAVEYAVDNSMRLSWIQTYEEGDPAERFRGAYLPTQEEVERGMEMMEERLDEQVAEGEMTEDQRQVAGGMAESVAGGMSFERVDGVADMASWSGSTLYVLDGATTFQIESDISAEKEEDRAAAVRVANALMAACR